MSGITLSDMSTLSNIQNCNAFRILKKKRMVGGGGGDGDGDGGEGWVLLRQEPRKNRLYSSYRKTRASFQRVPFAWRLPCIPQGRVNRVTASTRDASIAHELQETTNPPIVHRLCTGHSIIKRASN